MSPDTYEELRELLQKMNHEKYDLEKQIEDNMLQIFEARSYAQEILDKEEEDFKVFSPRKIEDIYRDELEKSNVKQADYENRNQRLIARREELDSIISVLEKVVQETSKDNKDENEPVEDNTADDTLENISDNTSEESIPDVHENVVNDTMKDTLNKSVQNLTYLMHKINLSTKFIRQDPMRAKLELETVNKGIKKVTDKLNDIIEE